MELIEFSFDDYFITTDINRMDVVAIHDFLSKYSGWSDNIPFDTVKTSIDNSFNFGLFHKEKQIGFARIISDFTTVAYLGDVFVLLEFRGRGLSKWLMETITSYPELKGLRRWILLTGDAHGLYKQFGWKEIANPERWMELHNKDVYKSKF